MRVSKKKPDKKPEKKAVKKDPTIGSHRIRMRVFRSEANKVNVGAMDAIAIQHAFNQLSEYKLNAIGTEATTGYVEDLVPKSPDLDFEVLDAKGNRIAQLDTTGSNWTFEASGIMPVRDYKGRKINTLKVHCFVVFWMKKELGPIEDCCYWIKGEDVVKAPLKPLRTKEKWQDNHNTNKADWHKGLNSLIEELRRLSQASD
jgi:hypothetical protein